MEEHYTNCSGRKVILLTMAISREQEKREETIRNAIIALREAHMLLSLGEDWEAEATIVNSYNPTKDAAKKNVLRKVEGKTKSEKKAFKKEEEERYKKFDTFDEGNKMRDEVKYIKLPVRYPSVATVHGGGRRRSFLRMLSFPPGTRRWCRMGGVRSVQHCWWQTSPSRCLSWRR